MRAVMFFCLCGIIGYVSGVLHALFHDGIREEDIKDPLWIALTFFIIIFEFIAYWVLWPFGTVTYGRKLVLPTTLIMGVLWGFFDTMLYLSFWSLFELAPIPRWGIVIIMAVIPFQAIWHNLLWNNYISPEHNILEWNKWKVLLCHIPNTVLTLCYFALFGYVRFYVLFYILSLCGSTLFMKFPPPWSHYRNPPKETLIEFWKDREKAEYWNGREWETFSSLSTN